MTSECPVCFIENNFENESDFVNHVESHFQSNIIENNNNNKNTNNINELKRKRSDLSSQSTVEIINCLSEKEILEVIDINL